MSDKTEHPWLKPRFDVLGVQLGEVMTESTEDVVHLWTGILDVELTPRVSGKKAKSTIQLLISFEEIHT